MTSRTSLELARSTCRSGFIRLRCTIWVTLEVSLSRKEDLSTAVFLIAGFVDNDQRHWATEHAVGNGVVMQAGVMMLVKLCRCSPSHRLAYPQGPLHQTVLLPLANPKLSLAPSQSYEMVVFPPASGTMQGPFDCFSGPSRIGPCSSYPNPHSCRLQQLVSPMLISPEP